MVILVEGGDSDEPDESIVVILDRRSQVRSSATAVYNAGPNKQQGPRRIPRGDTVEQSEGSGDAGSSAVLEHECLVSLNWPAAA